MSSYEKLLENDLYKKLLNDLPKEEQEKIENEVRNLLNSFDVSLNSFTKLIENL